MTPGELNIQFVRGDAYSHVLTIKDADGVALDQSLYTWRAQIRRFYSDPTLAVEFTVVVVTSTVTFSLTAAQTLLLTHAAYVWDIERELTAGGDPQTIAGGTVTVLGDVTREVVA